MNSEIITKSYSEPPFCEAEILRYAGCKSADDEMRRLLNSCIDEARAVLCYNVCRRELTFTADGNNCDFGCFSFSSEKLAKNLCGCRSVILFCATVGIGLDRLIAKYNRVSPSRAVMLQALGSERVEALCDMFCKDISESRAIILRPRFSPGYGDLPLTVQRDIFATLECPKRIAVFLNDSLLMSPSKSVTAFAGICE